MRQFRVKWTFVAPDLEALETPHGCLVRHPNGTETTFIPAVRVGKRQGTEDQFVLVDSTPEPTTLVTTEDGDWRHEAMKPIVHYRHAADAE